MTEHLSGFPERCVFCSIVERTAPAIIIFEDEHTLAFPPTRPAALGHTLIVPKRHIRDFWDGSPGEVSKVAATASIVGTAVRRAVRPDGMNLVSSAGAAATQSVFHLHLHVVPRWENDAVGAFWPTRAPRTAATREEIAERIIAELVIR